MPWVVSLLTPSQNFIFMVLSSSLSSNPLALVHLALNTFAVSTWNVPWIFTWLVTSLHFFSVFAHILLSSWSFTHYLPYPFQSLLLDSAFHTPLSCLFSCSGTGDHLTYYIFCLVSFFHLFLLKYKFQKVMGLTAWLFIFLKSVWSTYKIIQSRDSRDLLSDLWMNKWIKKA